MRAAFLRPNSAERGAWAAYTPGALCPGARGRRCGAGGGGAALGAGIGALTGLVVKHGVDRDFQDRVRDLLSTDDSAAVFMVVDGMTTDKFVQALRPFGGDVLQTSLSFKDEEELRHSLFHE